MDLFGAATKGVDPKTGSYLSKEQRIAMFQASRGMGGSGNSGGGSGGNRSTRVSAQSSIVAVNKMAAITQKLQTNYQAATNNVAEQVARNTRDIQNLYNFVYAQRKQKLAVEKQETRDLQAARARNRFAAREKLVEGMASALSALLPPIQKAAQSAMKPLLSFWDKLKAALASLAAAWVIDNLPTLLSLASDFLSGAQDLYNNIASAPLSIRGIFSSVDGIVKTGLKIAGKVIRFAYKFGRKILEGMRNLTGKIVRGVKNFVFGLARRVGNLIRSAYRRALDLIRPPKPTTPKPTTPKARPRLNGKSGGLPKWLTGFVDKIKSSPLGRAAGGAVDTAKNIGSNLSSKFSNAFSGVGDMFNKGKEAFGNLKGSISSNITKTVAGDGYKPASEAAKKNWIKKALEPLEKLGPLKGVIGKANSLATGLLKRLPIVGMAIDILLNKNIEGQDWTEAIVRGIFSGGAGAIGAAGGAKVGAVLGGALGSVVPVVGTAIGAGLGAGLGGLIGSMIAGAIGDKAGSMTYEQFSGMTAKSNVVTDAIIDAGASATKSITGGGMETTADGAEKVTMDASSFNPPAADDSKMYVDDDGGTGSINYVDMPPSFTQIPIQKESSNNGFTYEDAPSIPTSDSESDFYRALAMDRYDLSFSGV